MTHDGELPGNTTGQDAAEQQDALPEAEATTPAAHRFNRRTLLRKAVLAAGGGTATLASMGGNRQEPSTTMTATGFTIGALTGATLGDALYQQMTKNPGQGRE